MYPPPPRVKQLEIHSLLTKTPRGECEVSEVAQSCPTLCYPMNCSLPGFSVHGIFPGKSTGVGCHFLLQKRRVAGQLREEAGPCPDHIFCILEVRRPP